MTWCYINQLYLALPYLHHTVQDAVCYCQVNGHSLVGATHHAAVDVLKEAGNDVTMIVARLTKKPKASRRRPARITSTSSRNRVQSALSPTATDAPQPAAGDVDSQRPAMSPAQPTVLSANQSLSPEPSNRMSGTATPLYEVGGLFLFVILITYLPNVCHMLSVKYFVYVFVFGYSYLVMGATSCHEILHDDGRYVPRTGLLTLALGYP